MYSILISDALNGVDIQTPYPDYWEKLLSNWEIRRAFLIDLEILDKSDKGELEPLPVEPSRDLQFLYFAPPLHTIEIDSHGNLRIIWIQTIDQLQQIFSSPTLSTMDITRDNSTFLEDIPFRLFQSEVDLDGDTFTSLLEALQPIDNPEILQLHVTIAQGNDTNKIIDLSKVKANLKWGQYDASASFSQSKKIVFPELSLSTVLEDVDKQIGADLHLTLELKD
jgi:hypothetical protein